MGKREVEILAPAGSYESMVAAVNAGADAVYIGGSRFGARAYADNLDEEAMIRAIDFVHLHGCRIYMTVNTLVKEKELSGLYDYLKPYYEAGLDAVLVQDLGVFAYIHEHFPKLPIHISTQMTVTGKYSARMLKSMGAVRVVPARELSLKEIREIYEETGMEVETFVHGALCYCYSGQCLFSSLIGGRSGNRGRCAQTCRLPFDVMRDGVSLNRKNEKYVLSLKDLCTLDILPDILEAGVCSLKIEGRMKSPRYTAGVVSIYRKYVDMYLKYGRDGYHVDQADRRTLLDLFDRGGQSEGYYKVHNGRDMVVLKEKPAFKESNQELFDYLDKNYVENIKKIPIRGHAFFEPGKPAALTVEYELTGDAKQKLAQRPYAASAAALILQEKGDVVEEAKNAPMDEERIRKQLMKTGDSPFEFEELTVTVKGNIFVPVQALNKLRRGALEHLEESVKEQFLREPEAAQELKEARSLEKVRGTEPGSGPLAAGINSGLEPGKSRSGGEVMESRSGLEPGKSRPAPEFTVLVNTREQFEAVLGFFRKKQAEAAVSGSVCPGEQKETAAGRSFGIYLASEEFDAGEWKNLADRCHEAGCSCYLMMPRIFRTEAVQYFQKNMDTLKKAGFDALGVASMEEPGFIKEHMPDMKQYFDHGMYVTNHLAGETMREYGADRVTIPVELNSREIAESGISGELIIYGYLPMMVSAQCIKRTAEGCTKRPELLYLKDRKGKSFPVRNQCRFCYNTIYNESPLSLKGMADEAKKLSPEAFRLNFTIEDRKTTESVLDAFYGEYAEGKNTEQPLGNFTRGHFKRGVE